MSRPPRRCRHTGKVRYQTHTEALLALVEVVFDLEDRLRSTRTKCPCRTYGPCRFCNGWHLTSKPWEESLEYQAQLRRSA